jgi:hypothetical protein
MRSAPINFVLCFLIFACVFSSDYLIAQDFYPLEVGNRWDYEVSTWTGNNSKTVSYYSIEVISDSLFSNGKTYYVLSDYDLSEGKYVRADEDFIYYYDENSFEEDTLYHLNVQIGDNWEEQFSSTFYISVEDIDTTDLFSKISRVIVYRLDGLLLKYVNLSDLFGPYNFYFPGEPPGTSNTTKTLIGGTISGEEFGEPLSAKGQNNSALKDFSLSQNFPNPFNPETKINFSIPEMNYVTLKVYDVLGNEIETLVNDEKPAGTYQVSFDASGKPSGVYFFQIKSKYSTLSKKMIYLK